MTAGVLVWLLGSTLGLQEPGQDLMRYEFAETHMGSEFKVILYSSSATAARRASLAAYERIAALDSALSDYQPESELSRLSAGSGGPAVKVSEDLFHILQRSKAMYERSGGAFDVTVGPVVRLWRRSRRERKLPAPETLEHALSLVSSKLMILDERTRSVRLMRSGMRLDLGGIAKGYASEEGVKVLRREGHPRCLVAGAGDIVVGDAPPGRKGWIIAIAPLEPNAEGANMEGLVELRNQAISTSGDTERFVEIDGKRYSHIVDAKTGLGFVDRCTVTVVAQDGGMADALDTAVYAMGPERGLAIVEGTPGAAAFVARATKEGRKTYETSGFRALTRPGPHGATKSDAKASSR